MKKTKTLTVLAVTVVMSLLTACTGPKSDPGATVSETILQNRMTRAELNKTNETKFMLLDHPWESASGEAQTNEFNGYKDKVYFIPGLGALVYGEPVFNAIPPENYAGGPGTLTFQHYFPNTDEFSYEEIRFENYDDLRSKLRAEYDKDIAAGYPKVPADQNFNNLIALYDAVIAGATETIAEDAFNEYLKYYYDSGSKSGSDSFYWQMDDNKVEAVKENIREYHFYDEELNTVFVVHVTTPPAYDAEKPYPALVMTDAVWRFTDVPALYEAMADGKAEPQILVTIGFDYDTDGWDNEIRGNILCDHKKEFLDFITDNMMPYLSGIYRFDHDGSTLFGHSQGGVFTHFAAFNYDRYENRPFAKYIIGSPTFWTPYFTCVSDYEEYKNEYGYFDRNDSNDRELFITAGDSEDEDYREYYGDNDSTLEGVEHLKERLDGHGVTYKTKIYKSNHYQYVSGMLVEYAAQSENT